MFANRIYSLGIHGLGREGDRHRSLVDALCENNSEQQHIDDSKDHNDEESDDSNEDQNDELSNEDDSDFIPSSSSSCSSSSSTCTLDNEEDVLSPAQKRHKFLQQEVETMNKRIIVTDAKEIMFQQLVNSGFVEFFCGGLIVDISEATQSTFKYRVLDFLYFLYLSSGQTGVINVEELLVSFITINMGQFSDYCKQLSDLQNLTPYTVRNYVDHLLKFLEWFIVYRKQTNSKKNKVQAGNNILNKILYLTIAVQCTGI